MAASPELTHVFTLNMTGPAGFPHVETKYSDLCVAHVTEGTLELPNGQKIAKVVTASDWMRIKGNVVSIDARSSALSDDGSLNMEFAYTGKMHVTPDVFKTFSGGEKCEVDFGQLYYYTIPRIFSRSEEYAWVNDTVFVGQGKIGVKEVGKVTISYQIFRVG